MRSKFFIKMFTFFIVPIMIPLFLLGSLSGVILHNHLKTSIDIRNQDKLSNYSVTIDSLISELDWLSTSLGTNPTINYRLKNIISKCETRIPAENYEEINTIIDLLYSSFNANPIVESIYIFFDNNNRHFISSTNRISNLDYFYDTSWHNSYLASMSKPEKSWSEFRNINQYNFSNSTTKVLTIYRKIFSSGKSIPDGVLVLNIRAEKVNNILNSLVAKDKQLLFVLDNNYAPIFYNNQFIQLQDQVLAMKPITSNIFNEQINNNTYRMYTVPSSNNEWTYYFGIPRAITYAVPNRLTNMTIVLIITALILSMVSSYFFSNRNYKALIGIIDIFDHATQGKELPSLPNKEKDIYNYILYNVIETFLKNDFLEIQLSERKYKNQALELLALRTQLNPHFLFNTMETIYWRTMALTGKPNAATNMIENLSEILHYSLESSEGDLVSLNKEIQITNCYLNIQMQRYSHQFHVIWDLDENDAIKDLKIIKLILQPLIENSIYHGIRNKEDHSVIKIRIKRRTDELKIDILDNGLGIDKEHLHHIRRCLQDNDTINNKHIGLFNTHKRLTLTYGDRYGLKILSKKNMGTIVSIKVPVITNHV